MLILKILILAESKPALPNWVIGTTASCRLSTMEFYRSSPSLWNLGQKITKPQSPRAISVVFSFSVALKGKGQLKNVVH